MAQVLIRNWWAFALRGALGILLGLAAFLFPSITLGALVLLFGFYAVVDGVFAVAAGVCLPPSTAPGPTNISWSRSNRVHSLSRRGPIVSPRPGNPIPQAFAYQHARHTRP